MNDIKTWEDYPRQADALAIVGFSPTSRLLAPYGKPPTEIEVWGLNEEYNFPWMSRYERWFQMHQRWDFGRTNNTNHANHLLWLQNGTGKCLTCKGTGKFIPLMQKEEIVCTDCVGSGTYTANRRLDFPIYMQKHHDDIPGSVAFPLREVSDILGRSYYRSGFSYMAGLAMLMGYKRLELYGFEMGTETEYHYQKANGEWLLGIAHGRGIEVYLPEICSLLTGPIYGYEDSRIGMRQNLETRISILDNQFKNLKTEVSGLEAQTLLINELIQHPEWELPVLLQQKVEQYNKSNALKNFVRGAKTEAENITKMHDKYFTGPSEAEDPFAYNTRIVAENVKVEYAQESGASNAQA